MKNIHLNFEKTALPHLEVIYRAAFAMCSNASDAEDLTQSTFLRAFEKFDTFQKGTNCKAWLLQILRNMWIDQMRHRRLVGPVSELNENQLAGPERDELVFTDTSDLLENFSDEQIIKALKILPAEQRLTLFLVDVEQMTHEEAADVLDIPVGTVKSRTSRARANLKKQLLSHAKELGLAGGD